MLTVKGLNKRDWGGSIVRLNHTYRDGVGRYAVARITNVDDPSKHCDVVLLGHKDSTAIFMAYDTRDSLGVEKNEQFNFKLEQVGWVGKIKWYLNTQDPRIHIPAWLAFWSVVLGGAGLILGIVSLFR